LLLQKFLDSHETDMRYYKRINDMP
jgi:hypothetical protein